ncbi:MAG: hypothetical protein H6Q67_1668 [Firmicutes bacterium]|nr:hypothetical protein [Bacillota bacterium]
MSFKTGQEIIELHSGYVSKIQELQDSMARLEEYAYARNVIQAQLAKLLDELRALEITRFQPLEPVSISKSTLGHDFYIS